MTTNTRTPNDDVVAFLKSLQENWGMRIPLSTLHSCTVHIVRKATPSTSRQTDMYRESILYIRRMVFRKTIDPALAHTLLPPIVTSLPTDGSHVVPTSVSNIISKSDTPPRKRVRSTLSGKRNSNEYHMVRCCHCTYAWGTYGGRFQDLIWSRDLHQSGRHQRERSRWLRTSA